MQSTVRVSRVVEGPSLEVLLANVMRDTGWIMAGGSAQFRSGALSELQSSLGHLHQHAVSQRVAHSAKVLGEKAVLIAKNSVNDAEAIMGLHRVLSEFERAMKDCIGAAK